ncbi:hypothetical protein PQ465_04295 [Sphingobacterium oryzagri]|uniref:Uncharacterized protein n=1 Tax=Sphingobacterium oryzagri TaxID=3025669 RepID=A0ABY7WJ22_9SPHI|nr:hypothetical protein [Sphingobacterium sp. KACC 22765]WDF69603.1 hypothetical protein PQ465_04295 [Sphingobacterium sp. KACC 22765]
MNFLERLNAVAIPPLNDCGVILDKMGRLKTYFYLLENANICTSAEQALALINNVLIEVEDCHSGVNADEMPALVYEGRLYPVQEDFIVRENNRIIARSKGNIITIDADGGFEIKDRFTEQIIISKFK